MPAEVLRPASSLQPHVIIRRKAETHTLDLPIFDGYSTFAAFFLAMTRTPEGHVIESPDTRRRPRTSILYEVHSVHENIPFTIWPILEWPENSCHVSEVSGPIELALKGSARTRRSRSCPDGLFGRRRAHPSHLPMGHCSWAVRVLTLVKQPQMRQRRPV